MLKHVMSIFMGNFNYSEERGSVFGFFNIYHGIKTGRHGEGMKGFLRSFLDMAKDEQAIFEFLQNAVDAGSTKFCLFWGKDEQDEAEY